MKRTLIMLGLFVLAWFSFPHRAVNSAPLLAENSGGIVINPGAHQGGGSVPPPPVSRG